jgi:adenylylsulfate kinase-like enzyme
MMSQKGRLGETSRLRQVGMNLNVPACGRKILITGVSCVGKSSIGRRLDHYFPNDGHAREI